MEGMIGEIRLFGGNFSPRAWTYCAGQILAISSNTALFSILGTTYGGDGKVTFGIPDLRGRVAMGSGNGPGLTPRPLGQHGGATTTTLTTLTMPIHTHSVGGGGTVAISGSVNAEMKVNGTDGSLMDPTGNYLGFETAGNEFYSSAATSPSTLNQAAITVNTSDLQVHLPQGLQLGNTGSGIPYNNMQPYLGLAYIICVQGYYPSRN